MARAYEQKVRAESAAETRRRIIDAVIDRLRKAPAERVSVDAVAREAGVARSTVYRAIQRAGPGPAAGAAAEGAPSAPIPATAE